jgi:hypothetical protein
MVRHAHEVRGENIDVFANYLHRGEVTTKVYDKVTRRDDGSQ